VGRGEDRMGSGWAKEGLCSLSLEAGVSYLKKETLLNQTLTTMLKTPKT